MLFADIALASRIENAACRFLTDAGQATERRRQRDDPEVLIMPLGGGVGVHVGYCSPGNKVAGLGFSGPIDEVKLDQIESEWAQRQTPVQIELSCLADPSIGVALTKRGYVLQGFENVLAYRLTERVAGGAAANSEIKVRTSGDDEFPAWKGTMLNAFATPDEQGVPSHESFPRDMLDRAITDSATTPGMLRYIALRDGIIAGGASMRLNAAIAQLCGAATLPEHRRRGVQSALLTARLHIAAQRGCELATITTLPGSKSQQNAQRFGFQLLYTRAILVRDAVTSRH